MQNPNIQFVDIAWLKPYSNNARKHSKRHVQQIARSLDEFGFINPIIVDADGNVIAGHGRLEAAILKGMKTVPVICISHMTPEQIRAYRLADNKLAELSKWDPNILKIEFQGLVEFENLDLTVTGFEIPEIDKFLLNEDVLEDDNADNIDGFLKQKPISRPGDLWLPGKHRIICADALSREVYEKLMDGAAAQIVFTDPPFNIRVQDISGNGKVQHAEFAMASGEMTREEFITFLTTALKHMADFSVDGSIHFTCMDWRNIEALVAAGRGVYSELKNICVWAKDNGGMGSLYRSQHEFVAVFKNGTAPHINNIQLGKFGRYRTNIWNYQGQNSFHAGREEDLVAHPTVKPVRLVADAILDCSSHGGIVLDPFGGSGTTLLAAEKTGRRARLIELEPRYVDVTIRRWQKLTGEDAVHAETGKTFNQIEQEVCHDDK